MPQAPLPAVARGGTSLAPLKVAWKNSLSLVASLQLAPARARAEASTSAQPDRRMSTSRDTGPVPARWARSDVISHRLYHGPRGAGRPGGQSARAAEGPVSPAGT